MCFQKRASDFLSDTNHTIKKYMYRACSRLANYIFYFWPNSHLRWLQHQGLNSAFYSEQIINKNLSGFFTYTYVFVSYSINLPNIQLLWVCIQYTSGSWSFLTWNYLQIKGCFSSLQNKFQIQIPLQKNGSLPSEGKLSQFTNHCSIKTSHTNEEGGQ